MWALVGVGQAFGVASFPFLAGLAVEGKLDELNRLSHSVLAKVGAILLPLCGVMIVLSPEVIAVHGSGAGTSSIPLARHIQ